jgi:hypothetical protein
VFHEISKQPSPIVSAFVHYRTSVTEAIFNGIVLKAQEKRGYFHVLSGKCWLALCSKFREILPVQLFIKRLLDKKQFS